MNTALMFGMAVVIVAVVAFITLFLVDRLQLRMARSPRLMLLIENGSLYLAFVLAIGLSYFVWDYFPARTELTAEAPMEIRPDELPATAAGPGLQAAERVESVAEMGVLVLDDDEQAAGQ